MKAPSGLESSCWKHDDFDSFFRGTIRVNTLRAGVMDENTLPAVLSDGTVAASYRDVFAAEP